MMHKILLAATAAVAILVFADASIAFPVAPMGVQAAPVTKVTFWGKSFPYRYNWSLARACMRYETVDTSKGPVTERVWVCGQRRERVVSYRE